MTRDIAELRTQAARAYRQRDGQQLLEIARQFPDGWESDYYRAASFYLLGYTDDANSAATRAVSLFAAKNGNADGLKARLRRVWESTRLRRAKRLARRTRRSSSTTNRPGPRSRETAGETVAPQRPRGMYLGNAGARAPTPVQDSTSWADESTGLDVRTDIHREVERRRPLLAPGEMETAEFSSRGYVVTAVYVRTDWGPYRTRIGLRPA